jgi:hypothetical protein
MEQSTTSPEQEIKPKHAGGRPSKLTPEVIEKAWEYIDWVQSEEAMIPVKDIYADGIVVGQHKVPQCPNLAGLACYLKVARETLYEWGKNNEEIRHIIKEVQSLQENLLVKEGLSGRFNSQVTNRILAAKHDYKDKSDVTSNDQPLGVVVLPPTAND